MQYWKSVLGCTLIFNYSLKKKMYANVLAIQHPASDDKVYHKNTKWSHLGAGNLLMNVTDFLAALKRLGLTFYLHVICKSEYLAGLMSQSIYDLIGIAIFAHYFYLSSKRLYTCKRSSSMKVHNTQYCNEMQLILKKNNRRHSLFLLLTCSI